jgi:hypothetical protein
MVFAVIFELACRPPAIFPETASGWLRFGVTALPKTAPPLPR